LILRKVNLDRYDDWDLVRTNLIESERIISFVQKHLPDPLSEGTSGSASVTPFS
jgi:ATP-dependent DNA helicase RecG